MIARGRQNPAIHPPGHLPFMSQADTNRDILVYWLTIDYSCRTMCPERWTLPPLMVNQGCVLGRPCVSRRLAESFCASLPVGSGLTVVPDGAFYIDIRITRPRAQHRKPLKMRRLSVLLTFKGTNKRGRR